jgi:hypothetical protein
VSEPEPLTEDEIAYLQRPLTDEEKAATKRMPHSISEGFLKRKRAEEIAQQRSDAQRSKLTDAMEGLAGVLRDMERQVTAPPVELCQNCQRAIEPVDSPGKTYSHRHVASRRICCSVGV